MRLFIPLFILLGSVSCHNRDRIPDVSDIKINLVTERFEKDLFHLDTLALSSQLDPLLARYPSFGEDFMGRIINANPGWKSDSTSAYVRGFITAYRTIFDSSQLLFSDFLPYEKMIRQSLQFLKYYFPKYKAPEKIITYIGPLDGFGDALSDDAFLIGLHHHLGSSFPLYRSNLVQETYPEYISRRFEPGYIPINGMKNVVRDMYPELTEDKSLVDQMLEKGKRLYLLSRLLPYTEEYKLIGYTKEEMNQCYTNESRIWELFIQNDLLQNADNNMVKNYIGETPSTKELSDDKGHTAPGNIGSFTGWQIVKKYMSKNPGIPLDSLMKTDNETLFAVAKYKP